LTQLSDVDGVDTAAEMIRRLGELSPEEAVDAIAEQITMLLGDVLRMDPATIDRHRRIDTYGMDSLMGAELLVAARRHFDVEIPPLELVRGGGTVADITELVYLRLGLRRPERTMP